MKNNETSELFQTEQKYLEEALAELNVPEVQQSPMYAKYSNLANHYEGLLKKVSKLLKISDSQHRNLQKVQTDMRNLLDNAGQGFLTFGSDMIIQKEYSSECVKIFGRRIGNQSIMDLICGSCNEVQKEQFRSIFQTALLSSDQAERFTEPSLLSELILNDGKHVRVEYKVIDQVSSDGLNKVIMLILTDITEKRKAEAKIIYLNSHDQLTGLHNRAYIDSIIQEIDSEEYLPLSLIICDVNGLKLTNDVFGHQTGDVLLINIANVLKKCFRDGDIIARWGGDEFIVALPHTEEDVALQICDRIKDACKNAGADPIELSMAMGISTRRKMTETLAEHFSRAETHMYNNKLVESQQVRRDIIAGLHLSLSSRLQGNKSHIDRVGEMALWMADKMELDELDVQELNMLVLLHDIGNVAISEVILQKPSSLNDEEWEIIHKHCEIGFRMAQSISEFKLGESILAHHEWWDGSGYPRSLKGDQIPLTARILAVVDVYDIMTNDQPYRKAVSCLEAREELRRYSGSQFDPKVVEIFLGKFDN